MRDHADFVSVYWTTSDLFRVFSVVPLRGRIFDDGEVDPAVVVSEDFGVRQFGSADAALAQRVRIENRSYGIVGIAPRGFHFPGRADVWVPAGVAGLTGGRGAGDTRGVKLPVGHVDVATSVVGRETFSLAVGGSHGEDARSIQ